MPGETEQPLALWQRIGGDGRMRQDQARALSRGASEGSLHVRFAAALVIDPQESQRRSPEPRHRVRVLEHGDVGALEPLAQVRGVRPVVMVAKDGEGGNPNPRQELLDALQRITVPRHIVPREHHELHPLLLEGADGCNDPAISEKYDALEDAGLLRNGCGLQMKRV